jgi:hypothetical protein
MPNADSPVVFDAAELQIKQEPKQNSSISAKVFEGLLAVIFVSVTGCWAALLIWAVARIIG